MGFAGERDGAPVLETARLRLRGHGVGDLEKMKELWGDERVTRFTTGRPQTEEECWSRLLRYVGHWKVLGFGYWVVEEKATGAFVGEVGFSDYMRELVPSLKGTPEVGWVLSPAMHGKGYATEAVMRVLEWGREQWGEREVACIIEPEHGASVRVAERCGFAVAGEGRYRGKATVIFKRGCRAGLSEDGPPFGSLQTI